MSDPIIAPVEQPNPPVAGGNEPPMNPPSDPVSYETHRKLLGEKKRLQEERDRLVAQQAERDRKDMEARGEYQKLADLAKEEAAKLSAKLQVIESERLTGKKAAALLKALDNSLPDKFYGFLPMDDVLVDPETGEINQMSVTKAAEEFRKNYPELLARKNGPRFPTNAPQDNGSGTIARSEWKKLPFQEMLKWKHNQVIDD